MKTEYFNETKEENYINDDPLKIELNLNIKTEPILNTKIEPEGIDPLFVEVATSPKINNIKFEPVIGDNLDHEISVSANCTKVKLKGCKSKLKSREHDYACDKCHKAFKTEIGITF